MDTTSIVGIVLLAVTGLLLLLISGAEAGVIALRRSRVRGAQHGGMPLVLGTFIQQRHQILRSLSVAATVMIVLGIVTTAFLVLRDRDISIGLMAVVGVASALIVLLLRQTARAIALLGPELTGALLQRPIGALQLVFAPLAWIAEAPVNTLLRLSGRSGVPADVDPAAELMAVLEPTARDDGQLAEERRMMRGIMAMSDQTVRELMSPRMDLTAISTEASIGDVMRMILQSGFTRIPLYEESVDRVIGVIYAKDLLAYLQAGDLQPNLTEIARPPYFVPETKRANELLADMRHDQVHMAIAVDEYGGTAGVITVEDLLEEIVGQIADEYDSEEVEVQRISESEAIVDARLPLDELNELFGTAVSGADFDTVGGLIFSLLGRLAAPGDEVITEAQDLRLRVLSILGRRIKRVRVVRLSAAAETEDSVAAV